MRSFYVYVRTTDNQFMSCMVYSALSDPSNEHLCELAYKEFSKSGNPLPPAFMIQRMRFLQDHRNFEENAGYERVEDAPQPDGGYCVYSELTPETPRH